MVNDMDKTKSAYDRLNISVQNVSVNGSLLRMTSGVIMIE